MWHKHSFIWMLIILLLLIAIPIISTPAALWDNAKRELALIESAFGNREAVQAAERATRIYDTLFIQTGLVDRTRAFHVSDDEREMTEMMVGGIASAVVGRTNNYIETVSALAYVIILRLNIFIGWLPYILPFMLGAACEGYARRKIKFATFGQYGAMIYSGAQHTAIFIMVLPILYFLAPFPFTPLFVPFWALAASVPIVVLIANASQLLPR